MENRQSIKNKPSLMSNGVENQAGLQAGAESQTGRGQEQ